VEREKGEGSKARKRRQGARKCNVKVTVMMGITVQGKKKGRLREKDIGATGSEGRGKPRIEEKTEHAC